MRGGTPVPNLLGTPSALVKAVKADRRVFTHASGLNQSADETCRRDLTRLHQTRRPHRASRAVEVQMTVVTFRSSPGNPLQRATLEFSRPRPWAATEGGSDCSEAPNETDDFYADAGISEIAGINGIDDINDVGGASTSHDGDSPDAGTTPLLEMVITSRPKLDQHGRPILLGPPLDRPADAARELAERVAHESVELFGMLCLTTTRRVICWREVRRGPLNGVAVESREVFKPALLMNAASIILAHIHPSGQPHANAADLDVTRPLFDFGVMLGLEVLDHLIIGGQDFVSLRAPGVHGTYRKAGQSGCQISIHPERDSATDG
jgi:DNA repair protein RadC